MPEPRSPSLGSRVAPIVMAAACLAGPAAAQDIRVSPPIPLADGALHEYPDLARASDGTLWATYMSLDGTEEVVSARAIRGGVPGAPVELARGAMAYRPRIAAAPDGTVWVAWTGEADGRPQVFVRALRGGRPGPAIRVSRGEEAWHPDLTVDSRGTVWVSWEERSDALWRVMAAAVSDDDVVRSPFAVTRSDSGQMRPALAADGERVWLAWDEYQGGYDYDVAVRRLDREEAPTLLGRAGILEQAPALAPDGRGGVWIAWHSNRADDGTADVPRWIELGRWDGERLSAPAAPMPGRDLAADESIQGFEFASLLPDGDGRVWLFGRPSQGFYAQVFLGDRWSELTPFGIEGWGGRGQVVAAVRGEGGSVWTARRDIGGIVLQRLEWTGGAGRDPVLAAVPRPASPPPTTAAAVAGQSAAGGLDFEVPGYRLFFGDIHQHSSLSDGMGTVEDAYTRSRDRYGLDFAALADHEWFVRNRLLPSEWAYIRAVNASFHAPGEFISIPAYEWTGRRYPLGPGHKNVYFQDESHPIYSLEDSLYDSTPELFEAVKAAEAVAVPHHIGWTGVDWEHHDPVAQPDVEIVSVHGAFEHIGNEPIGHRGGIPGMFAQDGLERGLRFGLIGSSDGHGLIHHHGVGRKKDPWRQGLTGLWAPELTREAVFEALKARRVYATSGTPIRVWIEAEGPAATAASNGEAPARAVMGGELTVAGPPSLTSRVEGTGKVRYVHLLRDNEVVYSFGGDADGGRYGNFTFVDEGVPPGTHWYYLRVVQVDGEMAWSSPIWVEVTPP